MKITFEVKYALASDQTEKAQATITVKLPQGKSRYVIPDLLCDPNTPLFVFKLDPYWGNIGESNRNRSKVVSAKTWKELDAIVNKHIETAIKALRKVKAENQKLLANKPDDKVVHYEI